MRRRLCLWFVALLALAPLFASAQVAVQASVDRPQLAMGETLTLTISVDGAGQASMPDLSGVARDFAILGTSNNSSISIINGVRALKTSFGIALRPNHPGSLTIPAIAIAGQLTAPVTVTVGAAGAAAGNAGAGARDGPVFVEASVDTDHAVVGQQVVYTLRLFYAVDLTDGALGEPHADGLQVRHLESDANFQTQRGGNAYRVLERHYAIFPQHGGALQIPPVAFQGQALDRRSPDAFFDGTSPVSVSSNPVSLAVTETPAAAGNGAWLPASAVKLTLDGLPADGKARVGAPLTLTLTLEATGLPFEVLPAPTLPPLTGADVYPDKAVTGTRDDGRTLIGKRQQGFAVVPSQAGTLAIPAITVHWWNVRAGAMQTATVPASSLQVAPAAGGAPVAPVVPVATPVAAASAATGASAPAVHGVWFWVAMAALALWALTLLGAVLFWWPRRRRGGGPARGPAKTSARGLRNSFLAAARASDALRQEQALLAWARHERPALRSLGDLSAALGDPRQRSAIAALQQRRFGAQPGAAAGGDLATAFADGFRWQATARTAPGELPPLYP
jgi:hypothetical protein